MIWASLDSKWTSLLFRTQNWLAGIVWAIVVQSWLVKRQKSKVKAEARTRGSEIGKVCKARQNSNQGQSQKSGSLEMLKIREKSGQNLQGTPGQKEGKGQKAEIEV